MSRNILVAEDEDIIAQMYKAELERHSTVVTVVKNGQEAIDAMSRQNSIWCFLIS